MIIPQNCARFGEVAEWPGSLYMAYLATDGAMFKWRWLPRGGLFAVMVGWN